MSNVIRCYLDDSTERYMAHISRELGRSVEELAEAAIADAAIQYFKAGKLPTPPISGGA